jgi:hypothetical protein
LLLNLVILKKNKRFNIPETINLECILCLKEIL